MCTCSALCSRQVIYSLGRYRVESAKDDFYRLDMTHGGVRDPVAKKEMARQLK